MLEAPAPKHIVELRGIDAVSPDDAWAVGLQRDGYEYEPNEGYTYKPTSSFALHWDGSTWQETSASTNPGLFNVVDAVSPTDVWAVGVRGPNEGEDDGAYTLIEHFDGNEWTVVPSPSFGTRSELYGVSALDPANVWAVGLRFSQRGNPKAIALHYDGVSWQRIPSVNEPGRTRVLHDVLAFSPTDVWMVGYRNHRPLALHYDGSSWELTPATREGSGHSSFRSIGGEDSSELWAAGIQWSNSNGTTVTQRLEGDAWTIVPSPNPGQAQGGSTSALLSIDSPAPERAWAVGVHSPPTEENPTGVRPLVIRWDGSSWTPEEVPRPESDGAYLRAVDALGENDVWAAGASHWIRRDPDDRTEPPSDPYILRFSC